ncbi:spinster family MFS transporter [Sphingobium nicotianae]|uniref:spinster family MFS transporter n=1 Tax=Sphingobium nicotianae TaxID=2782607 RepID=UPI001BE3E040
MNEQSNIPLAEASSAENPAVPGVSMRYAWIVLIFLTLTNLLGFMDRYLINILAQPIKMDLKISDAEVGLLSGFAMSISYSLFGLPLAWLAERRSRVMIITASMIAWSFLTALCGRVTTYGQLVLARVGVGVGEAGGMPASHSLITDYFPPHRRGLALAIFTIAIPIGAICASIIGGWIVDHLSWREAFIYLGLPGALVAIIFALVVREAPRGRYDAGAIKGAQPRMIEVAAGLWRDPVTRQVILAYTSVVLVTTGASTFFAPFLARKYAVSYTTIGIVLSSTFLAGGILGNLIGGYLCDRLGRRDPRWPMWVPAIGILVSIPFYFTAYLQPTVLRTSVILFFPSVVAVFFTPPTFAVLHARTDPRARSMMVAIVGLVSGLPASLGPVLAGLAIDLLSAASYPGSFATACAGGTGAVAGASPAAIKLCTDALLQGTTITLLSSAPMLVWPALHYWLAARAIGPKR